MAELILPRRFKGQPQSIAQVNWAHPALQGVSASIIAYGGNWQRNLGKLISNPTFSGTIGQRITTHGPALNFNAIDTVVDYGVTNIPYTEYTLLFGGVINSFNNYLGLVDCTVNGVSGWNIFQTFPDTLWFSINGYSGTLSSSGWPVNQFVHGALRNKPGVSADWFRNGVKIATASGYAASPPTVSLQVGTQRGGGVKPWDGSITYFYLLDKYLSDSVIASFAIDVGPWQIFKAPARRLWLVPAGGINLVGAASTQANTSGTGAITQAHVLVGSNSAQANPSGTGVVTQAHILVGANSTQSNAASTGSISGGLTLTVAPASQSNSASTGAISQTHALAVTASTQVNSSTAVAVTQVHILAGANASQSNLAGSGAISLSTGNLTAAPSIQTNLSGTGAISLVGIVPDAFLNAVVSAGLKKPGIPADTVAWLRTLLEIMLGRRGNAIPVPQLRELTFSSTPTQAECQALYQYVNSVQSALADLINRFDT